MRNFPLTRTISSANFTVTAIPMENAAYFAFPSPVKEAESVSIPDKKTEERERSRTSSASVSRSGKERAG